MKGILLLGAAAAAVATGCGSTTTVVQSPSPSHGLNEQVVDMRDGQGNKVGTVTLSSVTVTPFSPSATATPLSSASPSASGSPSSNNSTGPEPGTTGVHIHVVIDALSPGSHGFHVHQFGRCDAPDFTSAGGHFNPFSAKHGADNPKGPHAGDLGNIPVGGDGKATVDLVSDLMTLEQDKPNSIVGTANGAALIIHAKADDETTDPAGNSGPRIACGVISQATPAAETPSPEATATPSPTATASARATPTRTATPKPTATPATPKPSPPPTPSTSALPSCSSPGLLPGSACTPP